MRIYLIGYMGSGKSKTAEALSKLLEFEWVDTDRLVEASEGKSISEIFSTNGQEYFREVERKVLMTTTKSNHVIISTGGGLPCYFDNMEWMNANGITIYLSANPGLLFHRLSTSKKGRPLIEHLDDVELMEQISGQLAYRIPFYSKADLTINALNVDVRKIVSELKSVKK